MIGSNFEKGDRYDSTRAAWEDIWDHASVDVELEAMQYPRAIQTMNDYLPYLSKDDIILEAGSGLSAVVITLRNMDYNIIGMDYAVNALRVSREHTADLPLLAGDVHALPFATNSLGAYLSFGVLEHFEHGMQPALAEAYRILRPGGVLVLTIPYPNVVYRMVQWRRKRQGKSHLTDETFYESTYTRDQLIFEVTRVGFHMVQAKPTSHSFTLWGLGGPFRAQGYYRTTAFAEAAGTVARAIAPWAFNFMTMIIARK